MKPEPSSLIHVTVASSREAGLERLLDSARHFGLSTRVLGLGEPWTGLGSKLRKVGELLRESGWTAAEVVLFTDAYDVALCAPAAEILERFHAFHAPLVFSAEQSCFPEELLAPRYPASTGPYPYLCSGAYIGRASAVLDLVSHAYTADDTNDQLDCTLYYLDQPGRAELDHRAELFQSNVVEELEHLEEVVHRGALRYRNRHTGTLPCLLHANASDDEKPLLDRVVRGQPWYRGPYGGPGSTRLSG